MAMLRYSIDRRIDASLLVQGGYSFVDGEAESLWVCEGLASGDDRP